MTDDILSRWRHLFNNNSETVSLKRWRDTANKLLDIVEIQSDALEVEANAYEMSGLRSKRNLALTALEKVKGILEDNKNDR